MRYPYRTYEVRNATIPTLAVFSGLYTISASSVRRYHTFGDSSLIHNPHTMAVTVPMRKSKPSIIRTTVSMPSSICERFEGAALLFIITLVSCPA